MKKNYITLKHPQHTQPKPTCYPHKSLPKPKQKHSLFSQLPQQIINMILSKLRLAEIVNLYWSIRYSHRYNQIRRSMLNYLILTNRCYTKWEQKQFLDLLVPDIRDIRQTASTSMRECNFVKDNAPIKKTQKIHSQNQTTTNPIQNIQISNTKSYFINNHSSASSISNNKTHQYQNQHQHQACYYNFSQFANNNTNDQSRLIRDKQSIANDVDRTYFQYCSSNRGNNHKANKNGRRITSNVQPINPKKINKTYKKFNEQNIQQQQYIQKNKIQKQNYKADQDLKQKNAYYITLSTQNHSNSLGNLLSPTNTVYDRTMNIQECYEINLHLNQPTPQPNINNCRRNSRNKVSNMYKYDSQNQQSSTITQNMSQNQQISSSYYSHSLTNPKINQQQRMQCYLKNVLIRISQKYPIIGYIQGFNYIVKNMYMTGFQENQAFRYMSYFIQCKCLGNIVLNNMEGIKQLSYVLKVYIFNYVPKIYRHLLKAQMEPQFFAISWFVTLFSEDLSADIVNKLWHLFVLEGWKIFIKFGIAFICAYQNQILEKQPDQLFCFMRRILEKFNEETRGKNGGGRIWTSSKRQEIVWKLMSSVEVSGSIMTQLCKQMKNLQKDSEIQIWRIDETTFQKRLDYSRNQRTYSHKTLTYKQAKQKAQRSSLVSSNYDPAIGSHLCCDRMSYINENSNQLQAEQRRKNVFSLCHNVGPYID